MPKPYKYAFRLEAISSSELWVAGFRGLLIDVDNTLVPYGSDELVPGRRQWVEDAVAQGFRIVLISNNFPERVGRLGSALGVPMIPNALKPLPFAYLRALRVLGTQRRRTLIIGDQLLTDLLGASLVGIRGILTEPLAPGSEFPITRGLRLIERKIFGRRFS